MTQTEAAKKEAGDAPPQNIKDESPNVSWLFGLDLIWAITYELEGVSMGYRDWICALESTF